MHGRMDSGTVCVTGASGFLGSWCVKAALDAGLVVHATTREAGSAELLKRLPGAADRLKIFAGCDLLAPGSFEDAVRGCSAVLHTASPFFLVSDASGSESLVKPAVEGTRNVLATCTKLGVAKVVLTSSTAAVYCAYGSKPPEHVFSEEDWSDEALLEAKGNFYALSKVRAERLAWEMAGASGAFKLAVMNPTLILGPLLEGQARLNTSSGVVVNLFSGDKQFKQVSSHVVDVRDVAQAHIKAALMPDEWTGWGHRFVLVGKCLPMADMYAALRDSDKVPAEWKAKLASEPSDEVPVEVAMGATPPHVTKMDVSRSLRAATEGGIGLGAYVEVQPMLEESFITLQENGLLG